LQARAETRLHVRMAPDGCPSAELLRQKLEPLLREQSGSLDVTDAAPDGAGIERAAVIDLGTHYRIEAAEQSRELADPARDCVERARVAAVFIALNVQTPPAQPPAAHEIEPVTAAVSVFGQAAYASQIGRGTGGGGVGLLLGYACWRFAATAAVLWPLEVPLRATDQVQASATLMRLPFGVTAACLFSAGRFGFGPALGVGLDVLRIRGAGADRPQTAWRVDPGLLAAAELRVQLAAAWSLGLRLGFELFARAYDLEVDPTGSLGRTPRLWLSAGLGLEWRFL
jgi:hypothetical protein